MKKQYIMIALVASLNGAISFGITANEIENQAMQIANEIKNKTVPLFKALADNKFEAVRQYLSASKNQLIPQQALDFIRQNISGAEDTLIDLVNKIPGDVYSKLNDIQAGLGSTIEDLKSKLSSIKSLNIDGALAALASIKIKDATAFVNQIKAQVEQSGINTQALNQSAINLERSISSLEAAASNLQKTGFLNTLNNAFNALKPVVDLGMKYNFDFTQLSDDEQDKLFDLQTKVVGALAALQRQLDTAKPFISAFESFSKEIINLIVQLYDRFGQLIWNQLPAAQKAEAQRAYELIKQHESEIMNVINTIKQKAQAIL